MSSRSLQIRVSFINNGDDYRSSSREFGKLFPLQKLTTTESVNSFTKARSFLASHQKLYPGTTTTYSPRLWVLHNSHSVIKNPRLEKKPLSNSSEKQFEFSILRFVCMAVLTHVHPLTISVTNLVCSSAIDPVSPLEKKKN